MNMYTAVMVLCMLSPMMQDMSGRAGNCISPAEPLSFPSLGQCNFYINQVRRRLSTRLGQEDIRRTLPTMAEGLLKFKGECRVPLFNEYLQCVDCEL